jgi:hypothetical protein
MALLSGESLSTLIMPDKVRPDAAWPICRYTNGESHHIDAHPATSLTTVKNSQKLPGLGRQASNLALFATLCATMGPRLRQGLYAVVY